jgi:hypothetical protein
LHSLRPLFPGMAHLALLLVAKDEVDPVMQVLADILRLQGLPMLAHKLAGTAMGPGGELHTVHLHTRNCSFRSPLPNRAQVLFLERTAALSAEFINLGL